MTARPNAILEDVKKRIHQNKKHSRSTAKAKAKHQKTGLPRCIRCRKRLTPDENTRAFPSYANHRTCLACRDETVRP